MCKGKLTKITEHFYKSENRIMPELAHNRFPNTICLSLSIHNNF